MPEMDGGQVAEAIHRDCPAVPILLLSAYTAVPEQIMNIVDASVTKGQGPQALLDSLAGLLTRRELPS